LVVCSIVLQAFIPVVTVDVGKMVNSALEQQLWDLNIKLHHNKDILKNYRLVTWVANSWLLRTTHSRWHLSL